MNAREGIKTYIQVAKENESELKTMNAREGIKTKPPACEACQAIR